jgi:hypothetical protein
MTFNEAEIQFTEYFRFMRNRPDRSIIKLEWIVRVIKQPEKVEIQQDRYGG